MQRRTLIKTLGIGGAAATLGAGPAAAKASELARTKSDGRTVKVTARQRPGKRTHWILPGPRRLDAHVFGTPEAGPSTPQRGKEHIAHKIWTLKSSGNPAYGLLTGGGTHDPFPVPVGWPENLRATNADGTRYTRTAMPLPFSDRAVGSDDNANVDGKLDLTYVDHQGFEGHGDAEDEIDFEVWFTDPAGNRYDIDVKHLEHHDGAHLHGRGVMTGAYLHGTTGVGTPLMPTQFAFGSFWGVGDVSINGDEPLEQNTERLVHFMTTQVVRTADYNIAIDSELPLAVDDNPDAYLGQTTHTHGFLPPVRMTADGPRKVALRSAFQLPNRMTQPFAHFMWDEDDVAFR